jgi:hypothetical protein
LILKVALWAQVNYATDSQSALLCLLIRLLKQAWRLPSSSFPAPLGSNRSGASLSRSSFYSLVQVLLDVLGSDTYPAGRQLGLLRPLALGPGPLQGIDGHAD